MTTLLLTGAGGFLGSHILQATLSRTDWDVVVVDSFRHNGGTDRILDAMTSADFPGQIGDSRQQILDDTRKRVRLCTHDLTAPFTPYQMEQIGHADYVVHAAARCSVDDSINDPTGHVRNNVESTLTMLELARSLRLGGDVKRYIHVSTDEVFGPGRYRDEDRHSPSSPYAASKAACEDLTRAWARTFEVRSTIVNSANLFGERQSQLAFIPKVIDRVRKGEPVVIHTQGAGDPAWRWYSYAPNVARWIVDSLTRPDPMSRHVLNGQMGTNVLKLAQRIAAILETDLDYREKPGDWFRPGFDGEYSSMPRDETWRPEIPATEGLEQTVKWYLDHPGWLS